MGRVQEATVSAAGVYNITDVLFFFIVAKNYLYFAKLKGRNDTNIEQFS